MIDADAVRSRLDYASLFGGHVKKLRRGAGGEATGLCPFHEDHSPSLSVNLKKGLFKCHTCGEEGDIFDFYQKVKGVDFPSAVRELGTLAGIVEGKPIKSKVVAKFQYHNALGKLLYSKERVEPGRDGRTKEFRFFHVDSNGRRLAGRDCGPVLYRLPEVLRAKYLLIVEGEAKADLLASWGLPATCLDSGSSSKVTDEMISHLTGKRAVVLPDHDAPGRQYANHIASALYGKAASLRIVELPGLVEKQDIIDWAKVAGNDKARLIEIIKATSEWTPQAGETVLTGPPVTGLYRSLPELMAASLPVREEVMAGIRRGEVTQLASVTNVGKTTLLLNAIVALQSGTPFLPLVVPEKHKPVRVLYVDCESPASSLRHDIAVMKQGRGGAIDANLLTWVDGEIDGEPISLNRSEHLGTLAGIVRECDVGLVVIDTVSSAFDIRKENENGDVTTWVMKPLIGLARSCNCAAVFAHHHGKPSESGGVKAYHGRGASAFGALSRTVLTLRKDETKGEGYAVLELAKSKGPQFAPTLLKLNRETRWFERCGETPALSREEVSVTEIAAWVTQQGGEGKTGDIVQAFKSRASERTIKDRLAEALKQGLLTQEKQGSYQTSDFVQSCNSYRDCTNAQTEQSDTEEYTV